MPETEIAASDSGDIRSALAAAITEHEAPISAPEPAKKPEVAEVAEVAESAPEAKESTERERGPDGKFVKKDEAEAPEAKAEPAEKPEAEAKPEEKAEEKPLAPDFQKALASWKQADQAMFKAQTPEAQSFIMRRYKEMTADYTKKLQDVSRLKTEYEPVDKMFEPHRDVMKQKGFTPASLVESWANVEKKLASGEQGALEVITGLVRGYGLHPTKVAQALGFQDPQSAQRAQLAQPPQGDAAPQQYAQLPPEVVARLQKLDQMEQKLNGLSEAQEAAASAAKAAAGDRAMQQIEEFKGATDDKGTLLRPYFEDVEQDMVRLANVALANGQSVPPLQELYETAVWANPSTREALRTAERQAAEQKRVDQEKAKAASARKAAVSVTGAPGSGQAPQVRNAPERSLRDEIEANAADHAAA